MRHISDCAAQDDYARRIQTGLQAWTRPGNVAGGYPMVPVDGKYRHTSHSSIRKDISRFGICPHRSEEGAYARRIPRKLDPRVRPETIAWRFSVVFF